MRKPIDGYFRPVPGLDESSRPARSGRRLQPLHRSWTTRCRQYSQPGLPGLSLRSGRAIDVADVAPSASCVPITLYGRLGAQWDAVEQRPYGFAEHEVLRPKFRLCKAGKTLEVTVEFSTPTTHGRMPTNRR